MIGRQMYRLSLSKTARDSESSLSCPAHHFASMPSFSSASNLSESPSPCAHHTLSHMHPLSDSFRAKLRIFKMNPIEKWRFTGQVPLKLMVQALKILLITAQLVLYGNQANRHFKHQTDTLILMKELFLTDADLALDLMPYPPSFPEAVRNRQQFYDHIDKAISVYNNVDHVSFGVFGYAEERVKRNQMAFQFCYDAYEFGIIDASQFFFNVSENMVHRCFNIGNSPSEKVDQSLFFSSLLVNLSVILCLIFSLLMRQTPAKFSIQNYLKKQASSINFNALLSAELTFPLRSVFLNSLNQGDAPDCYDISLCIRYDNSLHDGRVSVSLATAGLQRRCSGVWQQSASLLKKDDKWGMNVAVLCLCSFSCFSCIRSLYLGNCLRRETDRYFRRYFRRALAPSEHLFFVNFWIIFTILNDCFTIAGTCIKLLLEKRIYESSYFSTCSVLLALGGLLVWISILRYFTFFQNYNILILTVAGALPYIARFLTGTLIIFGGFILCGWTVLSPFHVKFSTISSTAECIFSLLNGDDMFMTFATLNNRADQLVWYFCRIYIYIFVIFFMYVVTSSFVALTMQSFESIQEYYRHGFPKSDLQVSIAVDNPLLNHKYSLQISMSLHHRDS